MKDYPCVTDYHVTRHQKELTELQEELDDLRRKVMIMAGYVDTMPVPDGAWPDDCHRAFDQFVMANDPRPETVSEHCRRTHEQLCHRCEDFNCGDNLNREGMG